VNVVVSHYYYRRPQTLELCHFVEELAIFTPGFWRRNMNM